METRNRPDGTRKETRRGGALLRIGTVALIAFMMAAALLPLNPTGARAANNDDKIDYTLVDPSVVNVDVQDPTGGTLLGDPPAEPTPDGPDSGSIQVAKYGCDSDYAGDYNQLAANCAPMSAPFAVNSASGEQDFDGSFTADNVAAGWVTVSENLPAGYGNPVVFCDSFTNDGGESGFFQAQLNDSTLSYELAGGEYLYCDWFNVPAGPGIYVEGNGKIHIDKFDCPLGYDAATKSEQDFATDCAQPVDGIGFSLTQDDAEVASGTTGEAIPGAVEFSNMAPSGYTIHEQLPDGYLAPVVFCSAKSLEDDSLIDSFAPEVHNAAVDVDLNEGEWLDCQWFNLPSEDGTITIHKWECPEGLAFVAEPTVDDLLAACIQQQNGVVFDLTYPSDPQAQGQTRTTGDDGAGTVVFAGVKPGDVAVTEEIPAGYGSPIVNCGWGAIYDTQDNGQPVAVDGVYPMTLLPNGELDLEWHPNEQMGCDWFNFPQTGGTIVIHKWECPYTSDVYNTDYSILLQACDTPMSGIDFTLADGSDNLIDIQNTDDSGLATFTNVPSGSLTLTEALPTGYGTPIVFCTEDQSDPYQYDVTDGGRIGVDLGNGIFTCDWFNVPTDSGSITIYKYTCPAGYNLYLPADPKNDCLDLTNGITYTLSGGAIAGDQQTTGDVIVGGVYWDQLDAATYTVQESIPAGTVGTFVTCQWYDAAGAYYEDAIQPYNSYGGAGIGDAIDLKLQTGDRIVCLWFNAPDYDGGDLIVTKYWCDGKIYDEQHCDIYGGGADFELTDAYGYGSPIDFTTGIDGTYHLSLTPGEYSLKELNRKWCRAESDQVNDGGYLVITEGQTSYVTVYNCGPGKVKEPPVKKFPNTGVGATLVDGNHTTSDTTIALAVAAMLLLASSGLALRRAAARKIGVVSAE